MSNYLLPIFAAFACAICNGSAVVLQKVSADKEKNTNGLEVRLLWRLFQDKPYILGIFIDFLGWVFTLIAVQYLPLFLVGSIIASGIVVAAFIERFFRHQRIKFKSYLAIIAILIGLVLLAIASSSQRAKPISDTIKYSIILIPVPVAIIAYVLARRRKYITTVVLGILSGIAFSGTTTIGRIFRFSQPIWHTIYSPLLLSIIVSGILGLLLFSTALQHAKATVINATSLTSQTIIAAIIGIVFFGDTARNGMWYLVIIGILVALVGVTVLSLSEDN
ncbi:MAG TPA: hypothetical protein VII94_00380 [Candidatus Saccharimonadales bacterium]